MFGVALLLALAGGDAGTSTVPACVAVSTEARYIPFGYNHVVILRNGCSKPAMCTVATDIAPQPQTVEVGPSSTVEVLTFMSSPSQTFTARVTCTLR